MANTIPILSFNNTFGDLLTQQNRQAVELNNLAANNYTKDSGTLFLNGSVTGLSVTAAALLGSGVVSGTLSVGSSVSALANVFINGSGNGLEVANNSLLRGSLVTNGITANTLIRTTTLNASGNIFANDISSNNLIRTSTLNAQGNVFVNNLQSNGVILGASANIVGKILTNSFESNTSIIGSTLNLSNDAVVEGSLSVGGDFVIDGTTVYNTNTFTINANSNVGLTSSFNVNRGSSGANASIRWNETSDYWDIRDVNNPSSYSKILTANLISSSLTSTSTDTFASSSAANTLDTKIVTANTSMKSYVDTANTSMKSYVDANVTNLQEQISSNVTSLQSQISSNVAFITGVDATQNTRLNSIETINTTQNTNITTANNAAWAGYARANTSANTFVGTSGTATPSSGVVSFTSGNGVTLVGSSNTITVNTPQDLQTTASPSFAGLTLSGSPTSPTPATNTSNTMIATTAFVQAQLNTGNTYSHSISGSSNTASFATTQAVTVNNGTIATTAFVRSIIPAGVILMWSGSIASVPSGWFLCDGNNSTPDLRSRFIVGAGSTYAVNATGGSTDAIVVSHTHTATVSDPGHNHEEYYYDGGGGGHGLTGGPNNYNASRRTSTEFTGISVGITTTGSSATNANLPPYYALAYIMKS